MAIPIYRDESRGSHLPGYYTDDVVYYGEDVECNSQKAEGEVVMSKRE